MSGAIPPLLQYAFMAWCLVKVQGQLYFTLLYYMEVSGQFHVPAGLPPGKQPPLPIEYEATGLDAMVKRKIFRSCWESNPSLHPLA
jgi:hypothetical protein